MRLATALLAGLGLSGLSGPAAAQELRLTVRSGASSVVVAEPGQTLPFEVVAELVEPSAGLASLRFDLTGFESARGTLTLDAAFARFRSDGVPAEVGLRGIGAAQDAFAPEPRLGVGAEGSPVVVFRGELELPGETSGATYTLFPVDIHANAYPQGASAGPPIVAVGGGERQALYVVVGSERPGGHLGPTRFESLPRLQPRPGDPLPGLSPERLTRFEAGRAAFERDLDVDEGLGPLFNDASCVLCHDEPAVGGAGTRRVIRFARSDGSPLPGGPLLQDDATVVACEESLPPEADLVVHRLTTPLFGAGLVDRIPDAALLALDSGGRVHRLEDGRIGRFGWKAHRATLLAFTAESARDELGLTNTLFPHESLPNGRPEAVREFDRVADPEDGGGPEERVALWLDFQDLLAPPPQTPPAGMRGERVFEGAGCARCHVPSYRLPESHDPVFSGVWLHPYSDFRLHDMGALGDGLAQGDAGPTEMRTAPLWGLAGRRAFLHDGRASGGTFAESVTRAIEEHAGEAAATRQAFGALSAPERAELVAFLGSLGRLEFDADADGDVDRADHAAYLAGGGDLAGYELLLRALSR